MLSDISVQLAKCHDVVGEACNAIAPLRFAIDALTNSQAELDRIGLLSPADIGYVERTITKSILADKSVSWTTRIPDAISAWKAFYLETKDKVDGTVRHMLDEWNEKVEAVSLIKQTIQPSQVDSSQDSQKTEPTAKEEETVCALTLTPETQAPTQLEEKLEWVQDVGEETQEPEVKRAKTE